MYRNLIWDMPGDDNSIYLTFDDGPHPEITPYVLSQLAKHNAKATFFCIGKNVAEHPDVYKAILGAGHAVGNHTHNHLNGWKTTDRAYSENIETAAGYINSRLFRPPYGRIKMAQAKRLLSENPAWKIYMWDVLSGDFDTGITPEQCAANVTENVCPGSIIVFHDSDKAKERLEYALPVVLEFCKNNNWNFKALS